MQEALMLWESIANSHWFKNSALILFLNKMDLFKAKIATSPITKFGFSDFQGDTSSSQQTSKYFMDKFIALNRTPSREVYGHFTNATDTDLLKVTMSSVQDMIIQRNLQKLILWGVGGHDLRFIYLKKTRANYIGWSWHVFYINTDAVVALDVKLAHNRISFWQEC